MKDEPNPPDPVKLEEAKPKVKEAPTKLPSNPVELCASLLKDPLSMILFGQTKKPFPWRTLVLISLIGLITFGLVLGGYNGGAQLWIAPTKIVFGLIFSAILCLPSFLIFNWLCGSQANTRSHLHILLCMIALVATLLLGFAPIIWLFSSSSESIIFFGFIASVLWLVSLSFSLRLLTQASKHFGSKHSAHLKLWFIIFSFVTLQVPVSIRPIIGEAPGLQLPTEKKFFLGYWLELMSTPQTNTKSHTTTSSMKE